jgi:hypothetical protein
MKHLLLVLMAAAVASSAFAQITIHNTDFSPVGYTFTWGINDNNATFSPGSSGANQTYTFSAQTWGHVERHTYMAPSAAPHNSSFPGATRVDYVTRVSGSVEEGYHFQQITATQFLQLGFVVADSVYAYQSPVVNGVLPTTYGSNWTTLQYYEQQMAPGISGGYKDSVLWNVDGWGTLNTPYGSQPVLRAFLHHFFTFFMNGTPLQNYEFVSYVFINQAGESPVVLTSDASVTDPNFTTGTIAMMGVPLAAEPVRDVLPQTFTIGQNYPNPFNPTTVVPFALEKNGPVSLDVFNEIGQSVLHEEQTMPAGNHQFFVDGSRWTSGIYFARVSAGAQQQVLKMNLLK